MNEAKAIYSIIDMIFFFLCIWLLTTGYYEYEYEYDEYDDMMIKRDKETMKKQW